jgi:carbamate kinase
MKTLSEAKESKEILLVALGGNALVRKGQIGTAAEQFDNLHLPMRQIARLSERFRIVITHGNGPQVGNLLLQEECCDAAPKMPLEILVAQTQGQIGYMIESTLDTELSSCGIDDQGLVSLISYVVVDEDDPAFKNPSKPIGPFYSEDAAARLPYPTVRTPNGYRRVVPSPQPIAIVEKREIRRLLDMGFIVICCGGGGIPVIREGRAFHGVDAVIDKDLASSVLAREIGVNTFVIATDVAGVYLDYGERDERFLRVLPTRDARRYAKEGCFPGGSMGPKVEAACKFVESGCGKAMITSTAAIEDAIAGRAGTQIVPGEED